VVGFSPPQNLHQDPRGFAFALLRASNAMAGQITIPGRPEQTSFWPPETLLRRPPRRSVATQGDTHGRPFSLSLATAQAGAIRPLHGGSVRPHVWRTVFAALARHVPETAACRSGGSGTKTQARRQSMIPNAVARFSYFFRPFRRGAYRHAPSIEELYVMRQSLRSRVSGLCRGLVRTIREIAGR
jgi:hypothetical protein